jgi:glycosyltransferase involved in cell wall biosynthesis
LDIFLATRFTDALFIGKSSYFEEAENKLVLRHDGSSYRNAVNIPKRCCAISPLAQDVRLKDWLSDVTFGAYKEDNSQSIDIFNYCKNVTFKNEESFLIKVEDDDFDTGCSVRELQELSEKIEAVIHSEDSAPHFDAKTLFEMFPKTSTKDCTITLDDEGIHISSLLEDGKHTYIYTIDKKILSIDELFSQSENLDEIPFHLEVTPGLNLSFVVIFFDVNMTRLHHEIIKPNKNNVLSRPDGAAYVKLGFRVYQSGQCTVKGLLLGEKDLSPTRLIGSSDTLLLTNHYPSYDDLYRNGFVHSRVAAYRERGVRVDTFRFRKDQPVTWHEFQNVDVTSGSAVALQRMLSSGQYKNLLVHFLDSDMWEVIEKHIHKINVFVWIHGAEIQPWWRREYNYTDEKQLELAKKQSDIRLGFWRSILNKMHKNLKLIFVSNYFAEEVMEDIGFRLPVDQYEIIHNPVDTDLFDYIPKPPEQRLKVLSIRPYASRKYANDLSVNAVLELSKRPFFNEFEFLFMGDGKLFDETLAPIAHFDNVKIERRFLAQTDIAKYHKEFGIFLCPTRMDAQGVSKDEAMSSGLVVISNGVTAIPEFIDGDSGILVEGEDYCGMADALASLYLDDSRFLSLSDGASKRARYQVSKQKIVNQELLLLN